MRILFIGQNPSANNIDENVAFVGSKSYTTLKNWIFLMGIRSNDLTLFVNASRKIGKVGMKDADLDGLSAVMMQLERGDKVIPLGKYAEKVFLKAAKQLGWKTLDYYSMPHPSGLNRKLNNADYVAKMIKAASEYISS